MAEQQPRPQHPSRRPLERQEVRGRPYLRIPEDGFLTPRLRFGPLKDAIGFIVKRTEDKED